MIDAYVYIMRYGDGILKVGYSVDVEWRRKDLKFGGEPLDIVKVWKMRYNYARFVEQAAHSLLKPYLAFRYEFYRTSLRKAVVAARSP